MMNKQLLTYLFVCFGFSWGLAVIIWQMGGLGEKRAAYLMFPYMMGPGLAGLFCVWRFHKGERKQVLGFTGGWNLWLLWAWLIGLAIVALATMISFLGPDISPQMPVEGVRKALAGLDLDSAKRVQAEVQLGLPFINAVLLIQVAVLGAAVNVPLMLSEELGWRGWLWHHLRPKGFWVATAWIGLLWGIWHTPVIMMGHNYPGMPVWGPVLFTLFCLFYAPVFSYIREHNGSIWGPCVLHGTGNAMAGMALMMQTNADMPWRGVVGIGGFVAVFAVTLWVYFKVKSNGVVTASS